MTKIVNYDISINKLDDEWWVIRFVESNSTRGEKDKWGSPLHIQEYYKCDQIEGVIAFIERRLLKFK